MVAELHVETHERFNERRHDRAAEAANRCLAFLAPDHLDEDLCSAGVGDQNDLRTVAERLPDVADRIQAPLFLLGLHVTLRLGGINEHPGRRSRPRASTDGRRAEHRAQHQERGEST